ncbi:helix-turn-helix domain-containing protein [Streptomyces sp. CA-278952]|uniref:helix-turn-helix domain-containing protein n=1 Tax=unclassified Streptomyces TaxID=2593676 RepID=UPI002241C6D2|nr:MULTISPECIES: helix-turn-helix domain-containing protein [unclassified Streptomyces]UZI27462.1 helix-turn-helix domain-containing protein [Streptomyces sp. VB1]WDG27652.1 helix-turn-helix domain-containing protein [Streptomyces sp. CA-278952]
MSKTDNRPVLAVRLDDLFKTVRPQNKNWTNAEVAEELKRASPELKVGGVYLSQLRTGARSNPSPDLLAALSRFFGVSVAYFFDDTVAESVLTEVAAIEALRQAGVRSVAMRAAGMEKESLQAVMAVMDQYRRMQGLPPVTDLSEAE